MNNNKLRIGKIQYANLFPIFHYLDKRCDISRYRFIKGVPSHLNKLLREDKLDISPSSSIEYLRNKSKYLLLPCFSISSFGPIKSILLFSKYPLNELDGKLIAVSSESETSSMLLKIILKDFLSLNCRFKSVNDRSVKKALSTFSAVLLIGDTALVEANKLSSSGNRHTVPGIYDLGELWYKYTGLPFVFALWVVKNKTIQLKKELVKTLSDDLIDARKYAVSSFSSIAKDAPQRKWFSEKELVEYWELISYDFTEKHLEGLKLFDKYAARKKAVMF
jgi:chorismate dehydratase